jgi:hypothetical protein
VESPEGQGTGSLQPVTLGRREAMWAAREHLNRKNLPWAVPDIGSVRDLGELRGAGGANDKG